MRFRTVLAAVVVLSFAAESAPSTTASATTTPPTTAEAETHPGCTNPAQTEDIVVAATPIMPWAPVLLAMQNGAFEAANLNVTIEPISGPDAIPPLSTGDVDAALGQFAGGFFNAFASGVDLRMVWPAYMPNPESREGFWVRTDVVGTDAEPDVAALAGQTIGSLTTGSGTAALVMAKQLAAADLTLDDVTFTQLAGPDALIALQNGAVAGAWLVDPVWEGATDDPNLRFLASYEGGQSGAGLIAGPTLLERPEVLVRFLSVISDTIDQHLSGDYLADAETVAQLAEALGSDPERLTASLPIVFDSEMDLSGLPPFIDELEGLLREQGLLEYEAPIGGDQVVEAEFATAAAGCS